MFGIFSGGLVLCTLVAIILGKHSADRRCRHVAVITMCMLLAGATRVSAASQTSPLSASIHSKASFLTTTTTHLPLKQSAAAFSGRQLVQSVSTVADLRIHLDPLTGTPEIELTAGTYPLGGTELAISSNKIIRAAPNAVVILDGGGNSRGFSRDVTLGGLSITGGSSTQVSAWIGPQIEENTGDWPCDDLFSPWPISPDHLYFLALSNVSTFRLISHGISESTLPLPGTFFLRPRRKKLPRTDL